MAHSEKRKQMTLAEKIAWDDTVLPFQLDRSDIRGRVARLDGVLEQVLSQHAYPPKIEALVAEAAVLTALIGQTIKLRWKLSLQIRGDGPINLIATDYYAAKEAQEPARIRAYASFDADKISNDTEGFDLIGKGMFAVLIDQGPGTSPYQGITPLAGGSLSACASTYFAQSEQLPTRFQISMGRSWESAGQERWRVGGVMLQHMPKASPFAKEATGVEGLLAPEDLLAEDNGENWNRANLLLDTVEDLELVGPLVSPMTLLHRLFHEEDVRVYDPQPVSFGCTCSAQKVVNTLSVYPAEEIATMTNDDGKVTADCQFCGAHYEFSPETLGSDATDDPFL